MELSQKYGKRNIYSTEVQLDVNNSIRQFESEDESLPSDLEENDSIFNSIAQLIEPSNATHLSVFISYTLVHSQPEAILFYLITDVYKKGSLKDMRRWAYEIYSTFVAPQAVSCKLLKYSI
jgi:Rho guanine nucleotide exchange factor 12